MYRLFLRLKRWSGFGGVILLLLAGGIAVFDSNESHDKILQRVTTHIQADFLAEVDAAQKNSARILTQFSASQSVFSDDGNLRLLFTPDCRLEHWSESERIPPLNDQAELCGIPTGQVFSCSQFNDKVFYLIRQENKEHVLYTLVPLQVFYQVENSFLPPWIFLGRYQNSDAVQEAMRDMYLKMRPTVNSVRIEDRDGNFKFALIIPDLDIFRAERRKVALWCGLLGLVFALGGFYRRIERRFSPAAASVGVVVALALLRGLLLITEFPSQWVSTDFFSPRLLAIDRLSPSLGDLTLNIVYVLVSVLLLNRAFQGTGGRLLEKWVRSRVAGLGLAAAASVVSAGLVAVFFTVCANMIENSIIFLDFSNIFKLDGWSFLSLFNLTSILVVIQLALLHLAKAAFHGLHFFSGMPVVLRGAIFVGPALAVFSILYSADAAMLACLALALSINWLIALRLKGEVFFRFDFVNFVMILLLFSLFTTSAVVDGLVRRKKLEMELIARRVADDHDWITESLFERVKRNINAKAFELDYIIGSDSSLTPMFSWLRDKIEVAFKGYETRLFLYGEDSVLVSEIPDQMPYLAVNGNYQFRDPEYATLYPHLWLVPDNLAKGDKIYFGQFELLTRNAGQVTVQVELSATEIQSNRLYPQLLLDDKIRSKSVVPPEYLYAIYKDKKLFRRQLDGSFPVVYTGPDVQDTMVFRSVSETGTLNLYYPVSGKKIAHVQTVDIGIFQAVNLFSFLFYDFVLAFFILWVLYQIPMLLRKPEGFLRLTLRNKIQAFLLGITLLPLLVVVFLLSPYVKERIYADMKSELQNETGRVASLVRDQYLLVRKPRLATPGALRLLKKRLDDIEKTILNDINIYNNKGFIDLTTQNFIQDIGLSSGYMNPQVYEMMRKGLVSDIVIEDRIGNITYFSGYHPILTADQKIIGFLNIPYLKNPDQVNEQSLGLMTFLVDIYVIVFLAMGVIGLIISNSITRPLTLLGGKLRATTLGKNNEPIRWDSTDEIGEIISSYNQMLEKLADSEKKLARNEREHAWSQMARQVAHEIKNPLTPMKLSVQHLVRTWNEGGDKLPQMFDKVTKTLLVQIDSLVKIADSFSQFARMPEQNRSIFKLNEVLSEVAELYSHDSGVQIELHLPEKAFFVNSDRDQLSRAFNNLVKNAVQAIEHGEGRIRVQMEVKGRRALIQVEDNGKGIPEEIRAKVFEPNFSTKTSGMGLGLAIVKKIIESSDGNISFESVTGKGTTFFVELPEADQPAS